MKKELMDLVNKWPMTDYRVYVKLDDAETKREFVANATAEGFTYGDGVPINEREPDDIMAINTDKTINFVGTNGHMAFAANARVGKLYLVRVDYKRFISGAENYLIE